MVKLKRIRIDRFRNVVPGTELHFADGFNVLLGRNGTGKTSLLRLLSAAASANFSEFLEEPLAVEYELESPTFHLRARVANERGPTSQALPGERPEFVPSLSLDFVSHDEKESAHLTAETKAGRTTLVLNGVPRELDRPLIPGRFNYVWAAGMVTGLFRASAPRTGVEVFETRTPRFDESLDFYAGLSTRTFVLATSESTATQFSSIGLLYLPEGSQATPTVIIPSSAQVFLQDIRNALGLHDAELQLTLQTKDSGGEATYGNLRFWLTRRDGSQYADEQLSYGQKRLLSFLYYLDECKQIVIADELVNGLHHAWIDLCVKGIGERQAFLTSQNPLLMDYLSFDTPERVKDSFILCSVGYDGDKERVSWRNMTDDEARKVFDAGQVGIETLSTILINEGLW